MIEPDQQQFLLYLDSLLKDAESRIDAIPGLTPTSPMCDSNKSGSLHNSLERQKLDPPKFHPNIRVAVMNRLLGWIRGLDAFILWLYGSAGAGKSAIVHTLTEICKERRLLLATFCFWKAAAERIHVTVGRFVATLADQVARAIPALHLLIEDAINSDPTVIYQSVDIQLSKLIVEPIHQLKSTGFDFAACPFVIIIDSLDKCPGSDVQSGIVKSLVTAFHHFPFRIRILIASRPEVHLQSTFNSSTLQHCLSRLALSGEYLPDKDIYRFLMDSFKNIRRDLGVFIPLSWPSTDILDELTRRSSGQLIFASTAVKYIKSSHHHPTHRLDTFRRLQPPRGEEDLPYAELDTLFRHVLSNGRDLDKTRKILGVLLILNPLLANSSHRHIDQMDKSSLPIFIAKLHFWQLGETIALLSELEPVIEYNWQSVTISASLSDFLFDPSRSHQFYLHRESILGDCAALSLRHQRCDGVRPNPLYSSILETCLDSSPILTCELGHEFGALSFQNHYDLYPTHEVLDFWCSASSVFEMLHCQVRHLSSIVTQTLINSSQNLQEQYPQLIYDFTAVCFHAFTKAEPDKVLTLLVFFEQHFHLLPFGAPDTASAFSMRVYPRIKTQLRQLISKRIATHPERARFTLTSNHYLRVAQHFMAILGFYDQT